MQKCEKCQIKFSWFEIYKSQFKGRESKIICCSICGTEHEREGASIIIVVLLSFLLAMINNYFLGYVFSISLLFSTLLNLLAFGFLLPAIYPFFIKFHSIYRANYKNNY